MTNLFSTPFSTPFSMWTTSLAARGITALPASHPVPVELWARESSGTVLHFLARGTTLWLRRYRSSDLTGLILRSECDCEEHRTAGAGRRTVLTPGATPLSEATVDGRRELGWRNVEAGLLDVPSAARFFDRLLAELTAAADAGSVSVVA